ncbi:putative membrane protein [Xanthomonas bromi]|nr:putative membrane protein [Xanthomonas bromi]
MKRRSVSIVLASVFLLTEYLRETSSGAMKKARNYRFGHQDGTEKMRIARLNEKRQEIQESTVGVLYKRKFRGGINFNLVAAIAALITVSACSAGKLPAIDLDSKLTCASAADARNRGEYGELTNILGVAFNVANSNYKGNTDIELYFRNVLMRDKARTNEVLKSMLAKCMENRAASIADVFRLAVQEDYEMNGLHPRYASCAAYNAGKIPVDDLMQQVAQQLTIQKASFNLVEIHLGDPQGKIYEQAIAEGCKANPALLINDVIIKTAHAQEMQRQAEAAKERGIAQTKYMEETRLAISQLDALIARDSPVPCALMKRIASDRNDEIQDEVNAAAERVYEAALRASPVEYAAMVRQTLSPVDINFYNCSVKNVGELIREYRREDAITLAQWAGSNDSAIAHENSRRSQVSAEPVQTPSDDEGAEMQMSRAAHFDAEEALYEERKTKKQ